MFYRDYFIEMFLYNQLAILVLFHILILGYYFIFCKNKNIFNFIATLIPTVFMSFLLLALINLSLFSFKNKTEINQYLNYGRFNNELKYCYEYQQENYNNCFKQKIFYSTTKNN